MSVLDIAAIPAAWGLLAVAVGFSRLADLLDDARAGRDRRTRIACCSAYERKLIPERVEPVGDRLLDECEQMVNDDPEWESCREQAAYLGLMAEAAEWIASLPVAEPKRRLA